jgi:hypothetical protein
MQLQYLDFDFSDEDSGRGSFDAMASVQPARLPPLLAEVAAVLGWATRGFGAPGALEDEGEWDYQLQALAEPDRPLAIAYDPRLADVRLATPAPGVLTTVTLTLSGSPGFCEALRAAFELDA